MDEPSKMHSFRVLVDTTASRESLQELEQEPSPKTDNRTKTALFFATMCTMDVEVSGALHKMVMHGLDLKHHPNASA